MKKLCIIDYGLGNIKSLYNALTFIGYKPCYFSETNLKSFDVLFIPGVGSFSKASKILLKNNFKNLIKKSINKSLIFGICLGMQILLKKGEENGNNNGLNLFDGKVEILKNKKKIILPTVGFQKINFINKLSFLNKFNEKKFYFVHSYVANLKNKKEIFAVTNSQGIKYTAAILKKRIIGTQFHPEKSGEIGLEFLKTIIENY